MVSNASDDLPDPESPVITVSVSRGISTSTFLRLCSRAPRMVMFFSMGFHSDGAGGTRTLASGDDHRNRVVTRSCQHSGRGEHQRPASRIWWRKPESQGAQLGWIRRNISGTILPVHGPFSLPLAGRSTKS